MKPKSLSSSPCIGAIWLIWLVLFFHCYIPVEHYGAYGKIQKLKLMKALFKAKMMLKPLIKSGAIKVPMLHLVMPLMMQSSLTQLMSQATASATSQPSTLPGFGIASQAAGLSGKLLPLLQSGAGKSGLAGTIPRLAGSSIGETNGSSGGGDGAGAVMENNVGNNMGKHWPVMYGRLLKGLTSGGSSRLQYMLHCRPHMHIRQHAHMNKRINSINSDCYGSQCSGNECTERGPNPEFFMTAMQVLPISLDSTGTGENMAQFEFSPEPLIVQERPELIIPSHIDQQTAIREDNHQERNNHRPHQTFEPRSQEPVDDHRESSDGYHNGGGSRSSFEHYQYNAQGQSHRTILQQSPHHMARLQSPNNSASMRQYA